MRVEAVSADPRTTVVLIRHPQAVAERHPQATVLTPAATSERPAATWAYAVPGPRTWPSATTTPGGRRAHCAGQRTSWTGTTGSDCSRPASSSAPQGEPDPLNGMLAASPLGLAADLLGPQVLGFLACAE